jgi:hypothetical protein
MKSHTFINKITEIFSNIDEGEIISFHLIGKSIFPCHSNGNIPYLDIKPHNLTVYMEDNEIYIEGKENHERT